MGANCDVMRRNARGVSRSTNSPNSLVFTSTRSSSLRISPVIGSFESLFL